MEYYLGILYMIGISVIMALGLNLITGVTGQLSLGHAAFMSIGAYTSAYVGLHFGLPFAVAIVLGGLVAALFGLLLGFPTLRLSGDYLAVVTLGFGEIVRVVLLRTPAVNGALGLSVPAPAQSEYIIVLTAAAILTIVVMILVGNSRFGRACLAVREDEIAAASLGVNPTFYKVQAFAVGSFFAGLGGGLYAHLVLFINPGDFGFMKSIEILNMVVLGGMGSTFGTILGSTVLTIAPELLRFIRDYRMLFYGGLLVFMMIFRPNGLCGDMRFDLSHILPNHWRNLRRGVRQG